MKEPKLPKFDYYLDESDPDVVVLRRQDGAFVGAFSARGATREGIVEAAKEDYRQLLLRVRAREEQELSLDELPEHTAGSTPLNRGHAARAASTSHFGLLPHHLGISGGGTHKLINSSTDQR